MVIHLRVRFLPRLFVLCLVIVASLLLFPSAPVHASGGGDICPLRAYYVAPVIFNVEYPVFGDGIDIYWIDCDTYHEEGAAYHQILVEQTGQVITYSGQVNKWRFTRPLFPEAYYSFRVRECFSDDSCTLFSSASYPIAAPTGWTGWHLFF